jgi:hypothetical protein
MIFMLSGVGSKEWRFAPAGIRVCTTALLPTIFFAKSAKGGIDAHTIKSLFNSFLVEQDITKYVRRMTANLSVIDILDINQETPKCDW